MAISTYLPPLDPENCSFHSVLCTIVIISDFKMADAIVRDLMLCCIYIFKHRLEVCRDALPADRTTNVSRFQATRGFRTKDT